MRTKLSLKTFGRPALIAALYYLAARFGLALVARPESVSTFWPPCGLLLGILALSKKRDWRWILPVVIVSHFLAEISFASGALSAAAYSVSEVLGVALGAWLLIRATGEVATLDTVGNVFAVLLIPMLVSNPLSATFGALIRTAGAGRPGFWEVWPVWWTSTSLGVTVVTPVVLTWPGFISGLRSAPRRRVVEGVVLALVFVVACVAIFSPRPYRGLIILPVLCLPFPLFMWAAARFGAAGVAMSSLLLSTFGLWQTSHNRGAIAAVAGRVEQNVLLLQIYLAVLICFSLLLSVVIKQQNRTMQALRESEARYRSLVEYLPDGVTVSVDDQIVYVNPAAVTIAGAQGAGTLLGRSVYDFVPAEFRAQVERRRAEMIRRRTRGEVFEAKLLRVDGAAVDVEARGVPIEFDGKLAIQNCIRDITDRKVVEERLRTTSDQLRALMASLQTAREEEGIRISREIHDELGSAFTSLRWDLEEVDRMLSETQERSRFSPIRQRIRKMFGLIDETTNVIRRISSELRPSILDDLGLVEAVEWQLEQFQSRTGITCHFDCRTENPDFEQSRSTVVFRIFQEALTNILRHSEATAIDVTMDLDKAGFELKIEDNGKGFTPDQREGTFSLGLLGMRERAQLVGGSVEIASAQGEGTTVVLRIPVHGGAAA